MPGDMPGGNLDRSFHPLRCNVHLIIGEVLVIGGNSNVIVCF